MRITWYLDILQLIFLTQLSCIVQCFKEIKYRSGEINNQTELFIFHSL